MLDIAGGIILALLFIAALPWLIPLAFYLALPALGLFVGTWLAAQKGIDPGMYALTLCALGFLASHLLLVKRWD